MGAPDNAMPQVAVEAAAKSAPKWVKILLVVAGLLLVTGVVLKLIEPTPAPGTMSAGSASLVDAQGQPIPGSGQAEPDWAPGFLKMGFSFFVAFAVGYAARKFLKVALVVAGCIFAVFFLGQYVGALEVKWQVMEGWWDGFTANAGKQFESMKTFITGSLPAAGLAGLGLFAGFKAG